FGRLHHRQLGRLFTLWFFSRSVFSCGQCKRRGGVAADERDELAALHSITSSARTCHPQPGLQIFHPQTNYKVTVWRNSSLSGRRRPSTTEPLRMLRDTSCLSFCARPALYGVCASLTSLLARGFRPWPKPSLALFRWARRPG